MAITPTEDSVASVKPESMAESMNGDKESIDEDRATDSVRSSSEPGSSLENSSDASQSSVPEDFFERLAYALEGGPWQ
jgi:hypothetical protein